MEYKKPLNVEEIKFLEKQVLGFRISTRKRYLALLIVFAAFLIINKLFVSDSIPVVIVVFYSLAVIAFLIIVRVLGKSFKKDLLSKTKICTEGILEKKYFKGHQKNMTSYEIDEDKKTLYIHHEHLGSPGLIILKYDRDNFEGKINQRDNLYFVIEGNECKVDVKHFVFFNEGERICIEQFFPSKGLIRIFSLDKPEKNIQTFTLKFS